MVPKYTIAYSAVYCIHLLIEDCLQEQKVSKFSKLAAQNAYRKMQERYGSLYSPLRRTGTKAAVVLVVKTTVRELEEKEEKGSFCLCFKREDMSWEIKNSWMKTRKGRCHRDNPVTAPT